MSFLPLILNDSSFFICSSWPLWVDYMTVVSHWLLILNSSCNIAIYLHKDPKFKAVLKEMFLSKLSPSMRSKIELSFGGVDDLELETVGCRKKVSCLIKRNQKVCVPAKNSTMESTRPNNKN